MTERLELMTLASDIVAAYVSANQIGPSELPSLLASTYNTLQDLSNGRAATPVEVLEPKVPIKKSVTPDYIICLEDGKRFKSLKRHLRTQYDMTPEEYRARWGLPADYPMVAPNYAKARSDLAKRMGLGTGRRGS